MATVLGTNVTKYDAGGSGDNIIPDGYIKTVEKVWLDSYTMGTTAIPSGDSIVIARIPPGKKITDIVITYPALTTENCMTGSTLGVGTVADTDKFIDDVELGVNTALGVDTVNAKLSARMNNADGHQYVTTGSTVTAIVLTIGRKTTTTTSSTIKTAVYYT